MYIIVFLINLTLLQENELGAFQSAIDSLNATPRKSLNTFNNLIIQGSDKIADLLQYKAMALVQLVKYDSAQFYFNKSIEVAETEDDTVHMTELLNQIADVYFTTGKYSEMLASYLDVLELYEGTDDCVNLSSAIKSVANAHYHLRDKRKSLSWQLRANRLASECENEDILQKTFSNISAIYYEIGNSDSAIYCMNKSLDLLAGKNNFELLSHSNAILGEIYQNGKDNPEKGLHHYRIAEDYALKSKNKTTIAFAYIKLGIYYNSNQEYQKAKNYLIKTLNIYQDLKLKEGIMYVQSHLATSYLGLNDADSVFSILNQKSKMKATVFNENLAAKTAEMQTKYESVKKERENELLRKENLIKAAEIDKQLAEKRLQFIVLFTILFFLIIGGAFWRNKNILKQKTELAKLEKRRFQAVIEAEEKERVRIAKELHDSLGQLLSTAKLNVAALEDSIVEDDKDLLMNSMNLIDDAVQEVRDISHNMMPNALIRLGLESAVNELAQNINRAGKINVELDFVGLENRLNESVEITVYRIIQEILNNMLKHSQAKRISVVLKKDGNNLSLKLSDDGVGFDLDEINKSTGIGWKNILSRISMLNGNIDIISNPGKGTEISIEIAV